MTSGGYVLFSFLGFDDPQIVCDYEFDGNVTFKYGGNYEYAIIAYFFHEDHMQTINKTANKHHNHSSLHSVYDHHVLGGQGFFDHTVL